GAFPFYFKETASWLRSRWMEVVTPPGAGTLSFPDVVACFPGNRSPWNVACYYALCNNSKFVIRSSIHHEIMVSIGHVREVVIVLSLHHDVKIFVCQELNVVDIIDTAAGLCRDDVCPLRNPPIREACRDDVHADLSTVRSRMGPDIVHRECQSLPGLSVALLLHLACKYRERLLGLQRRAELVPAQRAIALDHRLHEQIGGNRSLGLDSPGCCQNDGGCCYRHHQAEPHNREAQHLHDRQPGAVRRTFWRRSVFYHDSTFLVIPPPGSRWVTTLSVHVEPASCECTTICGFACCRAGSIVLRCDVLPRSPHMYR